MHSILYSASFAVGSLAAVIIARAENVIHQNLAVNVGLVAAVLFVGGSVTQLLGQIYDKLSSDDSP